MLETSVEKPDSDIQQKLENLLNPKTPEVDAKAVTKQMLLTYKVVRTRNTNVTPLESKREKV